MKPASLFYFYFIKDSSASQFLRGTRGTDDTFLKKQILHLLWLDKGKAIL